MQGQRPSVVQNRGQRDKRTSWARWMLVIIAVLFILTGTTIGIIQASMTKKFTTPTEYATRCTSQANRKELTIVLLLISPDFIDSDYCYSKEMQQALARQRAGLAHVIPIILRPVRWHETPLGQLQALPTEGRPITLWHNRDQAWQNVIEGIERVMDLLQGTQSANTLPTLSASGNSLVLASYPMFGFNQQRTHFNGDEHILSPTNVFRLVEKWSLSTGGSGELVTNSSPCVAEGIVSIGSEDHHLYALNAQTGQVLWVGPTENFILSSPTVADGVVYVGSQDHNLYAFDAKTGATLWFESTADIIISSPAVAENVVYIGSFDHNLYAFDTKMGTGLWTMPTGGPIASSPTIANGVVYVGSEDSHLYAFETKTGALLWASPTQGPIILSSPAVANNVVYVGTYSQKFYAFNAQTGETIWVVSTKASVNTSPTVANGVVYVGSDRLYAFEAVKGKLLWSALAQDVYSSPAVTNGVVYVGYYHRLYAFSLSDA